MGEKREKGEDQGGNMAVHWVLRGEKFFLCRLGEARTEKWEAE